jgi:hypothetical protein
MLISTAAIKNDLTSVRYDVGSVWRRRLVKGCEVIQLPPPLVTWKFMEGKRVVEWKGCWTLPPLDSDLYHCFDLLVIFIIYSTSRNSCISSHRDMAVVILSFCSQPHGDEKLHRCCDTNMMSFVTDEQVMAGL